MNLPQGHSQVLIAGAGPSGLMMAAQLLRYGVVPVIIDSKLGPTTESKALAVQARSIEIYRQMGLADRVVKDGKPAGGFSFRKDGKLAASLSFADVGITQTLFPFVLMYQQSKNERLLLEYLTMNCCPVYWNTSLLSVEQGLNINTLTLKNEQSEFTLTCDWLIGADGAHSTVRKQLQIPFNGDTYRSGFYLADVELKNEELDNDYVNLFLGKKGFAGFFGMPEANRYRVVGNLPDRLQDTDELQMADILPVLADVTKVVTTVSRTHWFATYKLHHRMADKFKQQQCFLIGDAAHIHSPVGGQGMNTGLQDAYNLAWKLAGVVNGEFNATILESYAAERMPVAKKLLSTTDRIFNIITARNWLATFFKRQLLPLALRLVWTNKNIREAFFERIAQLDVSYRDSKINLHLSQADGITAGDRLPYLKIYDEKKQTETDLHEWCGKPGFTLIAMGKLTEDELFAFARRISNSYGNQLNFFYLPPSNKNRQVYAAFDMAAGQRKTILVRPDMHIGLISDVIDMRTINNYLENVVGWVNR